MASGVETEDFCYKKGNDEGILCMKDCPCGENCPDGCANCNTTIAEKEPY